ncbi:MAG: capsid protein [Cressdnaviricota sp.]|nr:MAG: capsid protein [Cressdnaviricota sp.]
MIPKKFKRGRFKKPYKIAAKVANIAKKRYVRKGNLNISKISSDLMKLKALINVEKKRFDIAPNGNLVGQVNANATGTFVTDITPLPVTGTGFSQRTGSSIKIVSGYQELTFINQVNNNHKTLVQVEYWRIKGATQVPSTFLSDIYSVNPATGIIDLMSDIDPDYFGQAKCFYKRRFNVPAPQYAGQLVQKVVKIPMKLQHHIRFDRDSITVDDGQIIMIIRADSGNYGLVSAIGNMLTQQTLSGLTFNFDQKWYYVDN